MNHPLLSRSLARGAVVATLALAASGAWAQLLANVSVSPAQVKPGEPVTATVNFDVVSGTNCGLRVQWGDGSADDVKINQAKDVPMVRKHSYTQPGNYKVVAEGKTQGSTAKCGGRNQEAMVAVVAPPPAPAASAPASAAKPAASAAKSAASGAKPTASAAKAAAKPSPCPAGWTLSKAGVAKGGAFTCTAKPGTGLPAQRLACPGDLGYFENGKKGQLGCRV